MIIELATTKDDIDISNENQSKMLDDLGIKTQMNFNGPGGQERVKSGIRMN